MHQTARGEKEMSAPLVMRRRYADRENERRSRSKHPSRIGGGARVTNAIDCPRATQARGRLAM
jgi:hypothetical protein